MPTLYEAFKEHETELHKRMFDRMVSTLPAYASLDPSIVHQRIASGLDPYARDLDADNPTAFKNYWQSVAYQRAHEGIKLENLMAILLMGTEEMTKMLREHFANDTEQQVEALDRAHRVTTLGIASVYAGYDQANNEVIAAQRSELQEISTPIIPIYTGVLVVPLVGTIDSRRAAQIMESLLEEIGENGADVVILDITGVPIIDTGVANYLLQAARAARLLGSQVILVGIGAEIAQTIVQLGIDLSGVLTRANLQSGIEYALAVQGMKIMPIR